MTTTLFNNELAIDGGAPLRQKPWPSRHLFGEEEKQAVLALFDKSISSGIAFGYGGEEEAAYCRDFCQMQGGGYADAVNSGTNALFVALAALDLPPYSEVIVPPITDPGGVMPVSILQCIPVPADSAPGTMAVGWKEIEAKITPRTSAIIVTHVAGIPAEMEPIMELARQRGLRVVEDCAQAHGSTYQGKPVGTFGDVAAFSTMFGKTHAFGGQGGVVYTQSKELYQRVREYSDRGKPFEREAGTRNIVASLNFNTDELHSTIGRVQLAKLPSIMAQRRAGGKRIAELCGSLKGIRMVTGPEHSDAVFWFLLFKFDHEKYSVSKEDFVQALIKEGFPFEASYNHIPCEFEWFQRRHSLGTSGLPWNAPQYTGPKEQETLSLPNVRMAIHDHFRLMFHENLSECDIKEVAAALAKVESAYLIG